MAQTAVKDVVIWANHIHGGDDVFDRIVKLKGGEIIDLVVDGWTGPWCRMSNGKDGRPTLGIRPIERTKVFWSELYASRRGEFVRIELPASTEQKGGADRDPGGAVAGGLRAAARHALLQGLSGFRSEGRRLDRDDLHDRAQDRHDL